VLFIHTSQLLIIPICAGFVKSFRLFSFKNCNNAAFLILCAPISKRERTNRVEHKLDISLRGARSAPQVIARSAKRDAAISAKHETRLFVCVVSEMSFTVYNIRHEIGRADNFVDVGVYKWRCRRSLDLQRNEYGVIARSAKRDAAISVKHETHLFARSVLLWLRK
jgi:hypothetical protein